MGASRAELRRLAGQDWARLSPGQRAAFAGPDPALWKAYLAFTRARARRYSALCGRNLTSATEPGRFRVVVTNDTGAWVTRRDESTAHERVVFTNDGKGLRTAAGPARVYRPC